MAHSTPAQAQSIDSAATRPARPHEPRRQLQPTPVLLVPGWGDTSVQLASLRARFIEAGWPPGRVAYMTFVNPVGSNRDHAREIARKVQLLREATGADEIDIVAHSMGGLATRRFLASMAAGTIAGDEDGEVHVRRAVFLATPHRGTIFAFFAWGAGSDEMRRGSPFLESLNALPAVPGSVDALAIRSAVDLRVVPGESAMLPEGENVSNVEICCPTHPGLLDHDETFRTVIEFLREGRRENEKFYR